jgi:hypothetical protein
VNEITKKTAGSEPLDSSHLGIGAPEPSTASHNVITHAMQNGIDPALLSLTHKEIAVASQGGAGEGASSAAPQSLQKTPFPGESLFVRPRANLFLLAKLTSLPLEAGGGGWLDLKDAVDVENGVEPTGNGM